MAITKEHISIKLNGLIDGISLLPQNRCHETAPAQLAEDYNKARALALQLHSGISEAFPPEIPIPDSLLDRGGNYCEVFAFSKQILGFMQANADVATVQ